MSNHKEVTEYAIFRKNENEPKKPLGATFSNRERAQQIIDAYTNGPEWLEIRSRTVAEWKVEDQA